MSPVSSQLTPSTRLAGRFTLLRELGTGGTATVWEVEDDQLGVRRAIKILTASRPSRREALRRRLRAEARAMAQLAHPNVLAIHDVGSHEQLDFVVMDLAEGGSLAEWVERTGPMDPHMALSFTVQVLAALAAAHAAGIVHRDVKPQNVLLNARGTALLADFGIALLTEDQHRTTRTGVAMGSLSFMAPEQRLDARSVGASADIYATGAMLYNLLTGANPVDLFTVEIGSPRLRGIPAPLQAILVKATRHAPSQRYESAQAMAREIVGFLPQAGDDPYRSSNPENFPAPSLSIQHSTSGRTPTIGADGEPQPSGGQSGEPGNELGHNPTLLPFNEEATRAAITFLGDDFELYAASVPQLAEPSPRGEGLTLLPEPNLPESGLLTDDPVPPAPVSEPEPEPERSPLPWVLAAGLLLLLGGGAWFWAQSSQVQQEEGLSSAADMDRSTSLGSEVAPQPETTSVPGEVTRGSSDTPIPTSSPQPEPPEQTSKPEPEPAAPDKPAAKAKAPAVTAVAPQTPPPQGTAPPFGKWVPSGGAGSLGYVELEVRGHPDKVRATWTAFVGANQAKTPLTGVFDPDSGRLSLSSADGRTLKLTLYLDAKGLQGEYKRATPTGDDGGHIDFSPASS
ncbi:MAG: protein kinase [Myxococcota bacterium]|nr:protein kinase [Myxococcota bacterium]